MPTPKTVSSYPQEYFELFRKATMERTTIKLSSHRDAAYLRLQLYGFRNALTEDPQADQELALMAGGLILKIRGTGDKWELIIEPRELDENLQAIRDAI